MEVENGNNGMMNGGGAPITGVIGTVLGGLGLAATLAMSGIGLFGNRNNGFGGPNGQGGPNPYQQIQDLQTELANVKADVAVNMQRDIDLAKQTELMIENAKLQAKIDVKDSEAKLTALITAVNNAVINNSGILGCVVGKVNDLTQIGIPAANIINPATTTVAGASTAG